jgi:hypothetical protein
MLPQTWRRGSTHPARLETHSPRAGPCARRTACSRSGPAPRGRGESSAASNPPSACPQIMLKKRAGRIINISSVVGQIGNPGQVSTL